MWNQVVQAFQSEFADIADVGQFTRILIRLGMAVLLGALIGLEREKREAPAGLRTHMLVALGTAVFVLVPQQAGMEIEDLSRVIQGVLAGIGFLGAGAVLKMRDSGEVHGLTTAAGIWATAAIGVTVGLGREATAIVTTVLVLIILQLLVRFEDAVNRRYPHQRREDKDKASTADSARKDA